MTAAETIKSARCRTCYGGDCLSRVERAAGLEASAAARVYPEVDHRNPLKKKVLTKNIDLMYGHRGNDPRIHHLSPFEFTRHWNVKLLRYPTSMQDVMDPSCHVHVLESGLHKLRAKTASGELDLIAGEDYTVKDGTGEAWIPFPDVAATLRFPHTWIMVPLRRPVVPVFGGCPMPEHRAGNTERNARIILSYFRPWTLDGASAMAHVPHASALC